MASALAAAPLQQAPFQADTVGAPPAGWTCGVTGQGRPRWTVEQDGANRVLQQGGTGTFPWCVRTGTAIEDGVVEVRFRPMAGREDQAGGVVWRFKDGDTYYVARGNALENNVSLYYTEGGRRHTIRYVDAPVARGQWHALRVEFAGARIAVSLDGVRRIEATDTHIAGAGAVGVWTKADSVTQFSGFASGATRP